MGIGATTALFYAKAGARVLIVARRLQQLEETKKNVEKEVPGAEVQILSGDITDYETGKSAVKAAVDAWGRVDIVIANQFTAMTVPTGSAYSRLAERDQRAD